MQVATVGNVDQFGVQRVQRGSQPIDHVPAGAQGAIRLMPELDAGEAQDRRSGASFLLANAGGLLRRTSVTALLARGEEDRLDAVSFRHVFAQSASTPDGLVVRM